jgi:streptogramin lyase
MKFSIDSKATSTIRLPDQQISSIASGQGEVWAASDMTGAAYQIDEATEKVVGRVDSGGYPNLAFGSGAAWVTDSSGELIEIDPSTSSILSTTHFSEGAPAPISYAPVATGDSVWVISNEGKIFRIDPNTQRVVTQSAPSGLVGLDAANGSLWLVNGTARVERIAVRA